MKKHDVLVILSCLHTALFPQPAPQNGERVYCFRCGAYRDVMQAPHNYTVRCEMCGYVKEAGNAEITADTAAVRHSLRRPGHRTTVYDGEAKVAGHYHPPIPVTDIPPF